MPWLSARAAIPPPAARDRLAAVESTITTTPPGPGTSVPPSAYARLTGRCSALPGTPNPPPGFACQLIASPMSEMTTPICPLEPGFTACSDIQ